jgi:hypothetical protein
VIDWPTVYVTAGVTLAIGLVLLAVGIPIARRAARRRKVLLWTYAQTNVVSGLGASVPGLERLQLWFDDQQITAASVSRVIIWNDGTQSIPGESNVSANPLCISLAEGVRLLDVRMTDFTDGAAGVTVTASPTESPVSGIVSFKFLNPGDGFVVQLIHSGKPEQGVVVRGTLDDVDGPTYVTPSRWFMRHLGPLYLSMAIAFALLYFYQPFPKGSNEELLFFLAVFFASIIVPLVVVRRWPGAFWRPPGKLKAYAPPPIPIPRRR